MAEYRRFIAKTFEEAKKKMILEMGDNAYIVKVNKVSKKGMLGFMSDDYVEIQAGKLNYDATRYTENEAKDFGKLEGVKLAEEVVSGSKVVKVSSSSDKDEKIRQLGAMISKKQEDFRGATELHANKNAYYTDRELDKKVYDLQKSTLEKMESETNVVKNKITTLLRKQEFSNDFIEYVLSGFSGNITEGWSELAYYIASQFNYTSKPRLYASGPNMVILVGSTGVGKSTTLSKMASQLAWSMKKKTMMCTFDVKRIMAAVQLEKYAEMLELPFRVITDKMDLKKMLKEGIEYSYILFDTSGITKRDEDYFTEMKDFFEFITLPKEIHLCLNAVSRQKEMFEVMKHFEPLKFDRVIITKTDESSTMGPVLSALHERSIAISYITNGQDVPTDIELGSVEVVKEKLLKEWKDA